MVLVAPLVLRAHRRCARPLSGRRSARWMSPSWSVLPSTQSTSGDRQPDPPWYTGIPGGSVQCPRETPGERQNRIRSYPIEGGFSYLSMCPGITHLRGLCSTDWRGVALGQGDGERIPRALEDVFDGVGGPERWNRTQVHPRMGVAVGVECEDSGAHNRTTGNRGRAHAPLHSTPTQAAGPRASLPRVKNGGP